MHGTVNQGLFCTLVQIVNLLTSRSDTLRGLWGKKKGTPGATKKLLRF